MVNKKTTIHPEDLYPIILDAVKSAQELNVLQDYGTDSTGNPLTLLAIYDAIGRSEKEFIKVLLSWSVLAQEATQKAISERVPIDSMSDSWKKIQGIVVRAKNIKLNDPIFGGEIIAVDIRYAMTIPEISGQSITEHPIKTKDGTRAPTANNWIMLYKEHDSKLNHDSVDMMKFIFRSFYTSLLSDADREQLSVFLNAYEALSTVHIDTTSGKLTLQSGAPINKEVDILSDLSTTRPLQNPKLPKLEVDRSHLKEKKEGVIPQKRVEEPHHESVLNLSGKQNPQQESEKARTSENHVVDLKNIQ